MRTQICPQNEAEMKNQMKKLIRSVVAWLVELTNKYACTTYGDMAELSSGPCARCVGRQVTGPPTK